MIQIFSKLYIAIISISWPVNIPISLSIAHEGVYLSSSESSVSEGIQILELNDGRFRLWHSSKDRTGLNSKAVVGVYALEETRLRFLPEELGLSERVLLMVNGQYAIWESEGWNSWKNGTDFSPSSVLLKVQDGPRNDRLPTVRPSLVKLGPQPFMGAAASVVEMANRWIKSEPIPRQLLRHEKCLGCFSCEDDSEEMLGFVKNVPLLLSVLANDKTDEAMFGLVYERALEVMGPKQFYSVLMRLYERKPELLNKARHQLLREDANRQRKSFVLARFSLENRIDRATAIDIGKSVLRQLQSGEKWNEVIGKIKIEHSHIFSFPLRHSLLVSSRIYDSGLYVIPEVSRNPNRYSQYKWLSENSRDWIMNASKDEVLLIINDPEQTRDGREPDRIAWSIIQIAENYPGYENEKK